jgi:hypothetical protein
MLAADIRKIILAHTEDDFAKSVLIKMRTSVTVAKEKMRRVFERNTIHNRSTVATFEGFVFCKGAFIDINFPTDAAAVLALLCYAFEFFVICRSVEFHRHSFAL